jgi:hypothetical protein
MRTKHCDECRFFTRESPFGRCHAPEFAEFLHRYVDDDATVPTEGIPAWQIRSTWDLCGIDGRWWEHK